MNALSPAGDDPHQVPAIPKVGSADTQPLTGADLKELAQLALRTWSDTSGREMADRVNEREHQRELEKLEYTHVARENDAERTVEERSDRRGLIFASAMIVLFAFISLALVLGGHGDIAGKVVKDAVIFASGLGVGQTRPVRALLGPRRRTAERNQAAAEEGE